MPKKKLMAFICHSSADKERFVFPFARALQKKGVTPWVDRWEMRPGDKLSKIFDELAKAEVVVPVLSKTSVNADWLRAEIDSVVVDIVKKRKRVIPVVLDGLDEQQFPAPLRAFHYVRGGDGDQTAAEVARGIFGREHPEKPSLLPQGKFMVVLPPDDPVSQWPLEKIHEVIANAVRAQAHLGWMHHSGKGVPRNHKEAAAWTRLAAEQGHPLAQYNFGQAHFTGEGVPRDLTKAAAWWRRAAEKGIADAQFNLGKSYYDGIGVDRSAKKAARWWRRAAEQKHAGARNSLGMLYCEGDGVAANNKTAVLWFRRAAKQGNAYAQDNLGQMYALGAGVRKNWREAFIWSSLAMENGHRQATATRKNAIKHLSPADLSAAEAEIVRRRKS